jgi:hypothetical protein
MDQAGYSEVRAASNRDDRKAAMSAFFTALAGFGRTIGMTMNANVQKDLFYAKSRKYNSTLEGALNGPNIPVSVYMRLIDGVNKHLPTFHRYLKLRKRMMGLTDDLHYYDLYAPLVSSVNLRYTPEEAQKLVLDAMAPLGPDYQATLRRAFSERLARLAANRRQDLGGVFKRRCVRRASVHAAQLPRAVQRRQHRWPTSSGTRCKATSRTRRSRTPPRTTRRSSPKSPRRSTRRCSSTTC